MNKMLYLVILLFATILIPIVDQLKLFQFDMKPITDAAIVAIVVEIFALVIEFRQSVIANKLLIIIFTPYDFLNRKWIAYNIKIGYENEKRKEIFKNTVKLALEKLKSNNMDEKETGLTHIYVLEKESNAKCKIFIYNSLKDVYQRENDIEFKNRLMEAMCYFHRICRDL